jgi:hypothetical protein
MKPLMRINFCSGPFTAGAPSADKRPRGHVVKRERRAKKRTRMGTRQLEVRNEFIC